MPSPPPSPLLLAVGHVTHDSVEGGYVAGGSAYYAAQTWRRFGVEPHVATAVGRDFAVAAHAFEGLAVHASRRGCTTVFVNHYPPGGRRVQWVTAQAPPITPGLVPAAARRPDVLFLAPVIGEIDLAHWLAWLRPRIVAVGVQGFVRFVGRAVAGRPGAREVVAWRWGVDAATLRRVQVAVLSAEDLAGQGDLLDRLRAHVPLVALTHGAAGAELFGAGRSDRIGVYATREVDPTGAGDTFAAGLLWGLVHGQRPREAARLGAAAASVVVEAAGGGALPRVAEAFTRIAAVPPIEI